MPSLSSQEVPLAVGAKVVKKTRPPAVSGAARLFSPRSSSEMRQPSTRSGALVQLPSCRQLSLRSARSPCYTVAGGGVPLLT